MAGSRATTIDQTIQTEKARSSAGIEIQRLRRAMRRPVSAQKTGSSGCQSSSTRGISVRPGTWISSISGSAGSWSSSAPARLPLHRPDREMHPGQRDADQHEEKREAGGVDAREVEKRAEGDRQDEPAEAADHADEAADRAHVVRVVDRDVLEDRGLAEAHEEAEREEQDDEGPEPHRGREGDRAVLALDHVVGGRVGQHEEEDAG